ncbi:sugar ABC transporter ATP-binding protein [Vineibacter terrae]|uniref:sugar ABC transporter ATP-binding protein n=1 Tax=Vineibacter terrae TaxID=2586908 RepID=UPI002E2FC0CD|nr:sugar ABC transporter ATP-binding protein [Vineibacter terrae]HEX2886675.1 sugar ABC transporter ATP-binding protein [Vineibacter terrae]
MNAAPAPGMASPADAMAVLRIENLSKRFGGSMALDGVDLAIGAREVHGLLGQNGSGKSTLIKILAGFHAPDPGARLWINGHAVALPLKPGDFRRLGIAFVHQHLGLVPSMSVLENLLIGEHAVAGRWRIAWAREAERAQALFARFGMTLDPAAAVETLTSVERAQLAIVRAFDQITRQSDTQTRLLVLDEPTPFLPAADVQKLFQLVRGLVAEGASVLFVSHDIDEVMDITDHITVLRDGRVADTLRTAATRKADIVRAIVGRSVDLDAMRAPRRALGGDAVSIEGLRGAIVDDVSIAVRRGEIVGLTGLIGSGYDEVVHLAYSATRALAGRLTISGTTLELAQLTPDAAIAAGIVLIPGDRQSDAVVSTLTVADNASLPVLGRQRGGWAISARGMNRIAGALAETFDVRPRDPSRLMAHLSGGNQQKVVLAKWFQIAPRLILLDEPTQGVDIGAREQIFRIIRDMSDQGTAVLCASSDHEQLAAICDRVIVLSRGRIVASLEGDAISKPAIAERCYASFGDTTGSVS